MIQLSRRTRLCTINITNANAFHKVNSFVVIFQSIHWAAVRREEVAVSHLSSAANVQGPSHLLPLLCLWFPAQYLGHNYTNTSKIPAPWTTLAMLWTLAASNANILNLIPVVFSLSDTQSLNGSQKYTVVNMNCDKFDKMPADVKWTHCVCLTGSSQKFTSRVCGFFWDHCSNFYIPQVHSNRG